MNINVLCSRNTSKVERIFEKKKMCAAIVISCAFTQTNTHLKNDREPNNCNSRINSHTHIHTFSHSQQTQTYFTFSHVPHTTISTSQSPSSLIHTNRFENLSKLYLISLVTGRKLEFVTIMVIQLKNGLLNEN